MKFAKAAYDACEGKDAAIVDTYARALYDNGKKEDAVKYEKKAIDLTEDMPEDNPQVQKLKKELKETLAIYKAGKPGKMDVTGDQVYAMYQEGKKQEISDYCMFDTLDTYFVFLRSRVLTGQLTLEQEQALVREEARAWIAAKVGEMPALQQYLDNWGAWEPWP